MDLILCSLTEYKESDSTACLAVAGLKALILAAAWLLLASPACLQVSRTCSTAGIKTALLAEHIIGTAFTGSANQPKKRETSGWLGSGLRIIESNCFASYVVTLTYGYRGFSTTMNLRRCSDLV